MDIKEIALRVAQATNLHYIVTSDKHTNDDWNIRFAEALIAEIAKQNEPVAWMCSDVALIQAGYSKFSNRCEGAWSIPVFTFPPTAEQIANETAEACARICDYKHNQPVELIEVAKTQSECAEAIRSGAWKDFKK